MSISPFTDIMESNDHAVKAARYQVVQESTAKAMEYKNEQPKLVPPMFQMIGVGNRIDITV